MDIISRLKEILDHNTYARADENEVIQAFQRLDVKVSNLVKEFFYEFRRTFLGGNVRNGVS